MACTQPITLYSATRPWRGPFIGLALASRSGLARPIISRSAAFVRSARGVRIPTCNSISCRSRFSYDGSGLREARNSRPSRPDAVKIARLRPGSRARHARSRQRSGSLYEPSRTTGPRMRAAVRLTARSCCPGVRAVPGHGVRPGLSVDCDGRDRWFVRDHARKRLPSLLHVRMGRGMTCTPSSIRTHT